MKNFTRIGLPILLVAGLVFGITFIQLYSPEDEPDNGPVEAKDAGPRRPGGGEKPLQFSLVLAKAPAEDAPARLSFLKYWDPTVEVGAPGHFEFWCQNRNPQPVTVRVPSTNCQCAGVEMAVVPPDALGDYVVGSALAHVALDRRLTWVPLNKDNEKFEQTVPAADPTTGPQHALVRLGWSGKGEPGNKEISADLFAALGASAPAHTPLKAEPIVVPAFDILARRGATEWEPVRVVSTAELRENGFARQTVYLMSQTRPYPVYSLSIDDPDPCISWSSPEPATAEELASLRAVEDGKYRRARSLYRVQVTIRERVEVEEEGKKVMRQLDLGLFDRRLHVNGVDAGTVHLSVRGRVLGDVTIQGADSGQIELGHSFPADQDRIKDVVLMADAVGLDLTVAADEMRPNYLRARLDPLTPLPDGRKQWRLRVILPKGKLYGALPADSVVVLKTNAEIPRRLRIPVRGMTYDSGGPRL